MRRDIDAPTGESSASFGSANETRRLDIAQKFTSELPESLPDRKLIGLTVASIQVHLEDVVGHELLVGDDLFNSALDANHEFVQSADTKDLTSESLLMDMVYNTRKSTGEELYSPAELVTKPNVPASTREAAIAVMRKDLLQQHQEVPEDPTELADAYLHLKR